MSIGVEGKRIYFFGAGRIGEKIYPLCKDLVKVEGFVDNSPQKQYNIIAGIPVISFEKLCEIDNVYIVITTFNWPHEIKLQLEKSGYMPGRDFCSYHEFLSQVYKKTGVLVQGYVESYITDYCSLKCKSCGILVPYIEKKRHYSLAALKENFEAYFSVVDRVGWLALYGGEVFLHPNLDDLIIYLGESYHNRITKVTILTNGTIIPPEKTLRLLNKYDVTVDISDYPVYQAQEKRGELLAAMEQQRVKYQVIPKPYWRDLYGDPKKEKGYTEEEVKKLFQECKYSARVLYEKRLYFCANDCALQRIGIINGDKYDYFALYGKDKRALQEDLCDFDIGNVKKGYVSLCRNCYGERAVNKRHIKVAEQI